MSVKIEQNQSLSKIKKKTPSVKSFAIASLRRASYRWPPRYNALKNAKSGRNQYHCAQCPKERIWGRKDVQVDHVTPIVSVATGWTNFDDFIQRLFCEESGLQVLCIDHHEKKTEKEKKLRKKYKELLKKEKEKYGE